MYISLNPVHAVSTYTTPPPYRQKRTHDTKHNETYDIIHDVRQDTQHNTKHDERHDDQLDGRHDIMTIGENAAGSVSPQRGASLGREATDKSAALAEEELA